jgi:large conductance mechanosensitive channel
MIKEFKEFINQGNVVDLAIAVVLGGAFGAVVNSFVKDILMNIIAAIFGEPDFSGLTFKLGKGVIAYGNFINAVITFLAIALALFMVVKAMNEMNKRKKAEAAAEVAAGPSEVELLTEIRDALRSR